MQAFCETHKFVLSRVRIRVGVFAVVIVVAVLAALALVAGRRGKLLHWAPLPSHCKKVAIIKIWEKPSRTINTVSRTLNR